MPSPNVLISIAVVVTALIVLVIVGLLLQARRQRTLEQLPEAERKALSKERRERWRRGLAVMSLGVSFLVIFCIAGIAAWLSFGAQRQYAFDRNGASFWGAIGFALLLDAGALGLSLMRLFEALTARSSQSTRLYLIVFVLASATMNYLHAPGEEPGFGGRMVAVIPPLVYAVFLEKLLAKVEQMVLGKYPRRKAADGRGYSLLLWVPWPVGSPIRMWKKWRTELLKTIDQVRVPGSRTPDEDSSSAPAEESFASASPAERSAGAPLAEQAEETLGAPADAEVEQASVAPAALTRGRSDAAEDSAPVGERVHRNGQPRAHTSGKPPEQSTVVHHAESAPVGSGSPEGVEQTAPHQAAAVVHSRSAPEHIEQPRPAGADRTAPDDGALTAPQTAPKPAAPADAPAAPEAGASKRLSRSTSASKEPSGKERLFRELSERVRRGERQVFSLDERARNAAAYEANRSMENPLSNTVVRRYVRELLPQLEEVRSGAVQKGATSASRSSALRKPESGGAEQSASSGEPAGAVHRRRLGAGRSGAGGAVQGAPVQGDPGPEQIDPHRGADSPEQSGPHQKAEEQSALALQ